MSRPATAIVLSPADRDSLIQYVRAPTTEQRLVTRARIILAAAQGDATEDIAKRLQVRDATVSKWRRRRREFLDFMNDIVADSPDRELHIVLDNLNTHKPKVDRWLARHPSVHFHYTPTHASWLNQIECWFSILSRRALHGASFTSVRQLREAIDRFIAAYNQSATPFEWRKHVVHSVGLKHSYAELRS